jgi:hypothetical protein
MAEALQHAIGKEHANEIVREIVFALPRKDGERWAQQFGLDLPAMARVSDLWAGGLHMLDEAL